MDDFLYLCDDAYNRDQILSMEREVLLVLGYDINIPVAYRFIRRLARVGSFCLSLSLSRFYFLSLPLLAGLFSYNGDTYNGQIHSRTLSTRLPVCGCEAITGGSGLHVPSPADEETWRMGQCFLAIYHLLTDSLSADSNTTALFRILHQFSTTSR